MNRKCLFTISIILIILLQIIPCFAGTITKEQLEEAIKNGEGGYNKVITDDEIILSNKYKINYDLDDILTFKINTNIEKEMEKKEYQDEQTKWVWFLPVIKAVFECKNVEDIYIEKIGAYYYNEVFSKMNFEENNDDSNDLDYNMPKAIKKLYNNINIQNDIFTLKIEEKVATDENYNVDFIMTINENADYKNIIDNYKFEAIKDESDRVNNEILNKAEEGANTYLNEIARDEEIMQEALNLIDPTENTQNDKNIEINEIPQTGKTFGNLDFLWVMLFSSVAILVLYTIYNRRIDGNN